MAGVSLTEMAGPWQKYTSLPPPSEPAVDTPPWLRYQTPAPEQMGVMEDVGRSLATGGLEGVQGLAGMGGDIDEVARSLGTWLGNKVRGWEGRPPADKPERLTPLPTTEDVKGGTDPLLKEMGVEKHTPQTMAGEFARTGGQFAPGVFALGGIPAGVKAGGGAMLKQAVAPAIATEGAGQIAREVAPEYEETVRGVTALGTGALGAAKTVPRATGPTSAELRATADAGYDAARAAGVQVAQVPFARMVNNLTKTGIGDVPKALHPKASAALKYLKGERGKAPTLDQLDKYRRTLGEIIRSGDEAEVNAASQMIDRFDDFMDNLSPADVTAGDPKAAIGILKGARANWKKMRKGEVVDNAIYRAENSAPAQRGNVDAAIRDQFRAIANNPRIMRQFTSDERGAIVDLARANRTERVLRFFAGFDPEAHPWRSGGGAVLGWLAAGPVGAVVMPTIGKTAQAAAKGLTTRQAENLGTMIRGGTRPRVRTGMPLNLFQYPNMATQGPVTGGSF